jgi:Fic family protein
MRETGHYQRDTSTGEEVQAFVPHPLPPAEPSLQMTTAIRELLSRATANLARLEVASELVPSVDWFVYAFVRKEATVSSQIEGTQATLVDLLTFEADAGGVTSDVDEVCNYLDALQYARGQLGRANGLPISTRLLCGAHKRLLKGARGAAKRPGALRKSQNWLGGTRPGNAVFVPPPPARVPELLSDLERYIHEPSELHPLINAGFVHVQYETIHPFLDGNGRLGRLLVALLLEDWKLLKQPLLYLSLFFKRHRAEYYRRLGGVRTEGDWEGWTEFFLEGVAIIADEAVSTARQLFQLVTADRERVLAAERATVMAVRLLELLPEHPIVTIPRLVDLLETTKPTAAKAVSILEEVGVLVETTGRRRDRAFSYDAYLGLLKAETDPL